MVENNSMLQLKSFQLYAQLLKLFTGIVYYNIYLAKVIINTCIIAIRFAAR
jgi:hypothetical protein